MTLTPAGEVIKWKVSSFPSPEHCMEKKKKKKTHRGKKSCWGAAEKTLPKLSTAPQFARGLPLTVSTQVCLYLKLRNDIYYKRPVQISLQVSGKNRSYHFWTCVQLHTYSQFMLCIHYTPYANHKKAGEAALRGVW